MADLVSPGIQISVTDESQYIPGGTGTVPLVILATQQGKIINGSTATGTTKATAGALHSFTSQRELVAALGYPYFEQSAAGTPLHGGELNEYGLMAAYSALGIGNRLYAIRADIDTTQLVKTAVRPSGKVANGTYWLDLANSKWGINEWDLDTSKFTSKTPIIISNSLDVDTNGTYPAPLTSIGTIGSYAVMATDKNNYIYFKDITNTWRLVGSSDWQTSVPAVTGSASFTTIPVAGGTWTITINTQNVTLTGTSLAQTIYDINNANITGVTAGSDTTGTKIQFYITSAASSTGGIADGQILILNQTGTALGTSLHITSGYHAAPIAYYGSYVEVPSWRSTDVLPRPNGSVWLKTSSVGGGVNISFKSYNSSTESWTSIAAPVYTEEGTALANLDPSGGGVNIAAGTVFVQSNVLGDNTLTLKPFIRTKKGVTKVIGTSTNPVFNATHQYTITVSSIGSNNPVEATITVGGTDAKAFVGSLLAANLANVSAAVESTGAISITHTAGGAVALVNVGGGTAVQNAGITTNTPGVRLDPATQEYILSNFAIATYTASTHVPSQAPADGTLWYYGDPSTVDIMINNNGWKGYRTVSSDARGYDLSATDPAGIIVSATKPADGDRSDGLGLVPGDLWLDSSDLENYPKIYRYNDAAVGQWIAIDNTDTIDQNGILFADARWDANGSMDPVMEDLPSIASLLLQSTVDLDAPDYRLYPRGMILFNTRRSGYNIKQYVSNKFTTANYPDSQLPLVSATWVTASGNMDNGAPYMGHKAQRRMVIKGLQAAIASNTEIREDAFSFSLITAPGYPELIDDMVALNNDRKNTAFVIGDTPLSLPANSKQITNWSNGQSGVYGDGLTTADPYLGVFYPHALTTDVQGNEILQPASHMMLRTVIRSDNNSYQWFAPAGTRRGLIDNATKIGYITTSGTTTTFVETGVNAGLRDNMYLTAVNPITVLPGVGLVAFGQKTRSGTTSALDRINVARLDNYIRTILASVGNAFLFEPNDKITRDQLKQIIEGAMNDLVAKRGIYDYLVVCDSSNNTPDRIARNELWVDIAIAPTKSVEFIYIPIRLKNPGDIAKLQ